MVFEILYHKPTQAVVAIRKAGHLWGVKETSGDFVVAQFDPADYNAADRTIDVLVGTKTKTIAVAVLAKHIDLDERFDATTDPAIQATIDQAEADWIHNKLTGAI